MTLNEKLGSVIKQIRKDKGVSQEQLALTADIDRTYISDIEKGERNVSILTLKKIADALQVSMSQIIAQLEE